MINQTIKSLKAKGYIAKSFETGKQAVQYMEQELKGKTIAFGDSKTLEELGTYDILKNNNILLDPSKAKNDKEFNEIALKSMNTEIYMLSANAITKDGVIINIDGYGNRLAGSLYGHKKIYYIIGNNKIVDNIEAGIFRARNIAAPINAKRLGLKTPCAIKGEKCFDCNSEDRICNGLLINLNKIDSMEVEVIIIDEKLGY